MTMTMMIITMIMMKIMILTTMAIALVTSALRLEVSDQHPNLMQDLKRKLKLIFS